MYSYDIEIIGMGCEIVACELSREEMKALKKYMKRNKLPLEEILSKDEHISQIDLGVNHWYELDDICHVYGGYPNMCRVKIKGEDVKVYGTHELKTMIDDFYSLVEFDSIHSIMSEKGILVHSKLITKEPFDPDLLTLLVTKLEKEKNNIYVITGFIYGNEYLKLESVETEEVELKTYINKTKDNLCII